MSLRNVKLFGRPLVLASVALIMRIGAAMAGESASDTQQRMRELLVGAATAHFVPQSARPEASKALTRAVDSQELVKQLLLGTTGSSAQTGNHSEVARASAETQPRERSVAYRDSQAAVRRVLLGQSHATDAS